MRIIFFHDNKITRRGDLLYSSGSLNELVVNRYLKFGNRITLGVRNESTRETKHLSYIGSCKKIVFAPIPDLAQWNFNNYLYAIKIINELYRNNDFAVIRLPSIIGILASLIAIKKTEVSNRTSRLSVGYIYQLQSCYWEIYCDSVLFSHTYNSPSSKQHCLCYTKIFTETISIK